MIKNKIKIKKKQKKKLLNKLFVINLYIAIIYKKFK